MSSVTSEIGPSRHFVAIWPYSRNALRLSALLWVKRIGNRGDERRDFIILGGTVGLIGSPFLVAVATAQRRPFVVGLLVGNRDRASFLDSFESEMDNLGYVPGQDIRTEFRSAPTSDNLLPKLAEELVKLKVDVIVAWFTPAIQAAQRATRDIPIVMAGAGDPVVTGLVASLSRPGSNVAMRFGALHESGFGDTFRTWRDVRVESVTRSKAVTVRAAHQMSAGSCNPLLAIAA